MFSSHLKMKYNNVFTKLFIGMLNSRVIYLFYFIHYSKKDHNIKCNIVNLDVL